MSFIPDEEPPTLKERLAKTGGKMLGFLDNRRATTLQAEKIRAKVEATNKAIAKENALNDQKKLKAAQAKLDAMMKRNASVPSSVMQGAEPGHYPPMNKGNINSTPRDIQRDIPRANRT